MNRDSGAGRTRLKKLSSAFVLVVVAGALFVAAAPFINQARARIDALPQDDPVAVIALSSGVDSLGRIDAAGAARLRTAAGITRRYSRSQLLTTRVAHLGSGSTSDSSQRALVESVGVPLVRWHVVDGVVHSTRDEAVRTRELLERDSLSVVVVTSTFHTRRACATFEAVGFRVYCRSGDAEHEWWRPALQVLYEMAATAKYRWNNWLG